MAQPIIGGACAARSSLPATRGPDSHNPKAGPSRQTLASAGLGEIGVIASALLKTINDEDRICDPIALAARGPLSRIEHLSDTIAECIGDGDDWSDEVLRARILDPQREGLARERSATASAAIPEVSSTPTAPAATTPRLSELFIQARAKALNQAAREITALAQATLLACEQRSKVHEPEIVLSSTLARIELLGTCVGVLADGCIDADEVAQQYVLVMGKSMETDHA